MGNAFVTRDVALAGEERAMALNVVVLQPLIALLAGILILIVPRLLNYIVAIYLILIGLAGLSPHLLRTLGS
jgi:hypothetical protein